jgi:hypothetical protein
MNTQEKFKAIAEAIIKESAIPGSKEITVTITTGKILAYLFISVGAHPVAIFSEREIKQITEGT